jgi:hypothetical protein
MDQVTAWEELMATVTHMPIGDKNVSQGGDGSIPPIPRTKRPAVFPSKTSWYIMSLHVLVGFQIWFYVSLCEERRKWEMANGVTRRYLLDLIYGSRPDREPLVGVPDLGLAWQTLCSWALVFDVWVFGYGRQIGTAIIGVLIAGCMARAWLAQRRYTVGAVGADATRHF